MYHTYDFAALRQEFPDLPATIVDAYDRSAEIHGDNEAIVEGKSRLSYTELQTQSRKLALALSVAGIKKGDHVGICAGNGVEWAVLFCAILRVGAVCVPINTRLKAQEIEYQLRQADVRLLFSVDKLLSIDFISVLRELCPGIDHKLPRANLSKLEQIVILGNDIPAGCTTYDSFLAKGAGAQFPALPEAHDDALIQFTSGTTSLPKGVLLTHRNIVTDAFFVGRRMGITSDDRYLSARPFFHVAGSTLSLVLSAVYGATLVTMQRFVAENALKILAMEKCTLTSGNDTMYLMMLNSPEFGQHEYVLRGGWAAASPSIMKRVARSFGANQTVVAYGLSEASPNIAVSDHKYPLAERIDGWLIPHPGLEVRIVDPETNCERPCGTQGEIRVRGWNVMRGYYNKPDETSATFDDAGFLKTGDIGVRRKDGALKFVGRLKEIIRVGGENVAPSDIEDLLHQHPKIRQAVVFAVPDPRLIEVPCAYVQARYGIQLTEQEIIEWVKPQLAGFKMPKHIAIVDSFEAIGMTASSKIQKRLLVDHAINRFGLELEVQK